ncbi:hypothetical protein GMDG_06275 [Pseudogymnoascus destructans 20631-21]|uniref:Nucleolar protein 16 n=2 Tax=Pseudogymnoascus destructans TaxID=655981 RepID=L8FRM6_PSED2|nr:hypothetical protein GMDG_06275 [Pseudogymnoascus destructans 20631-21]
MGRELQKKKNRSSIPKVKHKPKSKRVNPLGNAIIAANWDSKQTLTQNYTRLGLASRLNAATGGTEKKISATSSAGTLAITSALPTTIVPQTARVERDETGKIVKVIHAHTKKANPLNDPLNELESGDEDEDAMEGFEGFQDDKEEQNEVVRQLEEQALRVAEKKPRKQSVREQEWCQRLIEKWGEDYKSMVKDRRLNPMQQNEPDIRRRIGRWLESKSVV